MNKIFSTLLAAYILITAGSAYAGSGNSAEIKANTSKNEKTVGKTDVNGVGVINKADTSRNDSVGSTEVPFYEPKKKRPINIEDVYVSVGGAYSGRRGGDNAPYNNGATLNTSFGVPMLNKYFLLEFNNDANFMFAPNMNWFSGAFSVPASNISGVGVAFNDAFSIGAHVVLLGTRKFTLSVGPTGGLELMVLPSMTIGRQTYVLSGPISFCYGLKTNLYVGSHFYCYAQYSNITSNSVTSFASQGVSDVSSNLRHVPVDFGTLSVGAAFVIQPWW